MLIKLDDSRCYFDLREGVQGLYVFTSSYSESHSILMPTFSDSVRSGAPLLQVIYRDSKPFHLHSLAGDAFHERFSQALHSFLFCLVRAYTFVKSTLSGRISFVTLHDYCSPGFAGNRDSDNAPAPY